MKPTISHCLQCDAVVPDTEVYCEKCLKKFYKETEILKIRPEDVPTAFVAQSDYQPEGVPVKIIRITSPHDECPND